MRAPAIRRRSRASAGVLLAALLAGSTLPAGAPPAVAQAAASTAADDAEAAAPAAAETLAQVEGMLAQIASALEILNRQAMEALQAAETTTDLDAADRQMRLHFELSARAAEIAALEEDLRRQADVLRQALEGSTRP